MREKLIELLDGWDCPILLAVCEAEALADYLIENGVTVQRWIPVTERLPEDGQTVLTCKNGICEVQTYETRRNGWVSGRWFWSMAFVTHWMPLPTPPKDGDT